MGDSCPIGVSADSCPAGAPWMREWSTKFIPITPYTRVANKKLLTTTKIQNNDVWFLDAFKKCHYLDYNVIFNDAY